MVSVVIPTYKRAEVISETIQSIINQTYSNLEVIVVADGDCKDTKHRVEAFNDNRLKYYAISHSGRPAVPRNFGISKACGEYIAFCDDDDIWLPRKLEFQTAKMREDEKTGMVYTKCVLKNKGKQRIVPSNGKQGFIFKELFLSSCFIATSSVLIKRQVVEALGMFDEDRRLKAVEDFDFWLRISMRYKIGFVDKALIIHKEGGDSLTKGVLVKIKRHHLVPWKFYRNGYVGAGLFIKKTLRMLCGSSLKIILQR